MEYFRTDWLVGDKNDVPAAAGGDFGESDKGDCDFQVGDSDVSIDIDCDSRLDRGLHFGEVWSLDWGDCDIAWGAEPEGLHLGTTALLPPGDVCDWLRLMGLYPGMAGDGEVEGGGMLVWGE